MFINRHAVCVGTRRYIQRIEHLTLSPKVIYNEYICLKRNNNILLSVL